MESRVSRALSHLAAGLDLGHQVVGIPVGLAKAVMVKRGSIRSIADIMIGIWSTKMKLTARTRIVYTKRMYDVVVSTVENKSMLESGFLRHVMMDDG